MTGPLRADQPSVGVPSDLPETVFTFDGHPVGALPGQSLGAALLAAGYRSWRTTRVAGRPRGLFCGIGVCFDCLISVNGRPNERACMRPAEAGDVVTTQEGTGSHDA
jgi:2Fe-2S iron-sulfur cluster binding domain